MSDLSLAALACAVAVLATPVVRVAASRAGLVDVPGPRSLHARVTPRAGGVAVLLGVAATLAVSWPLWSGRPEVWAVLAGAAAVAAVGLADDRFGVAPLVRLAVHCAGAAAVVVVGGGLTRLPLPPPFDWPAAPGLAAAIGALWIVATLNFYNFLDGSDGLASIQGVITGAAIALAGWDPAAVLLGLGLAGASAGFLVFNWAPARIFLGDVGSGLLGFLFAAAPLLASPSDRGRATLLVAVSLWLVLFDATFTLWRRFLGGRRWFEPHREHLYQRLVRAGCSHGRVSMGLAVGSLLTTATGLAAWHGQLGWTAALAVGASLSLAEWMLVQRVERVAAC